MGRTKHPPPPNAERCTQHEGRTWRCSQPIVPGRLLCERHVFLQSIAVDCAKEGNLSAETRTTVSCSRKLSDCSGVAVSSSKRRRARVPAVDRRPNTAEVTVSAIEEAGEVAGDGNMQDTGVKVRISSSILSTPRRSRSPKDQYASKKPKTRVCIPPPGEVPMSKMKPWVTEEPSSKKKSRGRDRVGSMTPSDAMKLQRDISEGAISRKRRTGQLTKDISLPHSKKARVTASSSSTSFPVASKRPRGRPRIRTPAPNNPSGRPRGRPRKVKVTTESNGFPPNPLSFTTPGAEGKPHFSSKMAGIKDETGFPAPCVAVKQEENGEPTTSRVFSLGEIWALTHDTDGIPRIYARIDRIIPTHDLVEITQLEFHPISLEEMRWAEEDIPVSCGIFCASKFKILKRISDLSQHIFCDSDGRVSGLKSFYRIFPKKGEIWAVYRQLDGAKVGPLYELVEVISDFSEAAGLTVAVLVREPDLAGGFKRQAIDGCEIVRTFSRRELLRFSHRVTASEVVREVGNGGFEGVWKVAPPPLIVR